MPCVHHCHSIVVPSPPAPPLIISAMDPQTQCPEERGGGDERMRGGVGEEEKRSRGDGKMRRVVREETERGNIQ